MKLGIIKERNTPPDSRVVFSPTALAQLKQQYPQAEFKIESSDNRIFSDEEYTKMGVDVVTTVSDCDVFIGLNKVPIAHLIPNKTYFFSLHLAKEPLFDGELLRAILEKNISFYDQDQLLDTNKDKLINLDYYAAIVGTYNAFRAFGIKFELFKLPKAATLDNKASLISYLRRIVLPPIKIVITATGQLGEGCKEILSAMKIKQIGTDDFLSKKYAQAVYTQFDVSDYADAKEKERNNFEPFSQIADMAIMGHFHTENMAVVLSQKMLNNKDCKIKVLAAISPDTIGSAACVTRASTTEAPFYGFLPSENKEVDWFHPAAIVIMAVDDLPSELPKTISEYWGEQFAKHIIPALIEGNCQAVLKQAQVATAGKLTAELGYLQHKLD